MDPKIVSYWVHVSDPSKVTGFALYIRGSEGNWVRTNSHAGLESGWPLKPGWNEVRWHATSAAVAYLAGIGAVDLRFTKTGAITVHVGPVTIES